MHQVIKSKSILRVVNDDGRAFNLKVIEKGDEYGLNNSLTHDEADPLVSFYDATHAGQREESPFGQFISRYYVRTLLKRHGGATVEGLCLEGSVPEWSIDDATMVTVIDWLRNQTGYWQYAVQAPVCETTTTGGQDG